MIHRPRQTYLIAVKRILRYLKDTPHFGMHIIKSQNEHLYGYSDDNWARCPDDCKSTTGLCFYFGPNLLTWATQKQPTVSKSSCEAKYRALAHAAADIQWVLSLF